MQYFSFEYLTDLVKNGYTVEFRGLLKSGDPVFSISKDNYSECVKVRR